MGYQSAVLVPLLQSLGGWGADFAQTPRTETGADHRVTVHAYCAPLRRPGGGMALTMLFPRGGAVDPCEAEEAILH
jgi:hypothetical protein